MLNETLAYAGVMGGSSLMVAALIGLLGHGRERSWRRSEPSWKPAQMPAGGTLAYRLPAFGESRTTLKPTEQAGQVLAAVMGALTSWMGSPGQSFFVMGVVVLGMILIDYTTAHRAALMAGELVTSRKMHMMMSAKLMSYGTAFSMMFLAGFAFRSWIPATGVLGWIIYCECVSNLENLRKMAVASGSGGGAFYAGVQRIADAWLGKLPGVPPGTDITVSQTTTTKDATTTTTQTDTQVHVSAPVTTEQKAGLS
jgi:hypothetical protein